MGTADAYVRLSRQAGEIGPNTSALADIILRERRHASPRPPSFSIVSSRRIARPKQIFHVPGLPGDRRWYRSDNSPSGLGGDEFGNAGKRLLPYHFILDNPALGHMLAPGLELRFDKRREPAMRCGKGQCGRQYLLKRDEADIGGYGLNRLRHKLGIQVARIGVFKAGDAGNFQQISMKLGAPDIDGIDVTCPPAQQHLCETASRCSEIKRRPSFAIEAEMIERRCQFQRTAGNIAGPVLIDPDFRIERHFDTATSFDLAANRDETALDQISRP